MHKLMLRDDHVDRRLAFELDAARIHAFRGVRNQIREFRSRLSRTEILLVSAAAKVLHEHNSTRTD